MWGVIAAETWRIRSWCRAFPSAATWVARSAGLLPCSWCPSPDCACPMPCALWWRLFGWHFWYGCWRVTGWFSDRLSRARRAVCQVVREACGMMRAAHIKNGAQNNAGGGFMNYRRLGKTDLMVSEIGFGAEWMEDKPVEEVVEITHRFAAAGVNILDCWMPNPEVRSAFGRRHQGARDRWVIQGHIGATWQGGQYVRTRDMDKVRPAFEDLLTFGNRPCRAGHDPLRGRRRGVRAGCERRFITYVREFRRPQARLNMWASRHTIRMWRCLPPARARSKHHVQRESRLGRDARLGKPR